MTVSAKAITAKSIAGQPKDSMDMDSVLQLPAAFVLGFLCIYIKSFSSMTTLIALPEILDSGFFLFGVIFLLIHILSNSKRYGRRFIPLFVVILACVYTYLASGETIPLTAALCIIAAATAGDIKTVAKLWFAVSALFVIYLVAVSAIMAVLDPSDLNFTYRYAGDAARFSFLFSHPNLFAAIIMMMCGTYMYLNYERLRFSSFAVLALIALAVYGFTDSRTSFVLTLFEIVCFAIQKKWGLFSHRLIRRLIGVLPVLLFVAVLLVSGPFYNDSLGSMLTGRISLWHNCLVTQGITILGQPFEPSHVVSSTGWIYYFETIDCAYASGMFVFGLVFSGFFCWCVFSRVCRNDSRLQVELPLMATLLLFGITEVHAFNPMLCMPLFFLAEGILPKGIYRMGLSTASRQVKALREEA